MLSQDVTQQHRVITGNNITYCNNMHCVCNYMLHRNTQCMIVQYVITSVYHPLITGCYTETCVRTNHICVVDVLFVHVHVCVCNYTHSACARLCTKAVVNVGEKLNGCRRETCVCARKASVFLDYIHRKTMHKGFCGCRRETQKETQTQTQT